jgi:hypothetical protein
MSANSLSGGNNDIPNIDVDSIIERLLEGKEMRAI